tara:strand:- start:622 stop:1356 length:735 start_codon:yes stop_codon:yes gene_type:complete
MKGVKHVYSSEIWGNKHHNCENVPIILSESEYESIQSGSTMRSSDDCSTIVADESLWKQLVQLNDKLVVLSKKLLVGIKNTITNDVKIDSIIEEKKKQLNNYIDDLQSDKNNLDELLRNVNTLDEEYNTTNKTHNGNYVLNIVLYLIASVFIIIAIKLNVDGKMNRVSQIILYLIVNAILLFVFIKVVFKTNNFYEKIIDIPYNSPDYIVAYTIWGLVTLIVLYNIVPKNSSYGQSQQYDPYRQ